MVSAGFTVAVGKGCKMLACSRILQPSLLIKSQLKVCACVADIVPIAAASILSSFCLFVHSFDSDVIIVSYVGHAALLFGPKLSANIVRRRNGDALTSVKLNGVSALILKFSQVWAVEYKLAMTLFAQMAKIKER
eukprot:scaffold200424_cov17-Prasinocladus_malaysianus.AAC.1